MTLKHVIVVVAATAADRGAETVAPIRVTVAVAAGADDVTIANEAAASVAGEVVPTTAAAATAAMVEAMRVKK